MELGAEVEIVPRTCHSFLGYLPVLLKDEVVSHLLNRQQALQARVHVAEESVILEANDAILVLGQPRGCNWPESLVLKQGQLVLPVMCIIHDCGPASVHPHEEVE